MSVVTYGLDADTI